MKTAYSYTVLRYVHDVATGECVNVGVALYAGEARYASALCRTTYGRLSKVFPGMDGDSFKSLMRFVQARFEEIGARLNKELALEGLPATVTEFAHQVLQEDDSSLQWSDAASGLTENPSETLEALFDRLVMSNDEKPAYESRSDDDVWRKYKRSLETKHVLRHLVAKKISVQDDEVEFSYAWKNGFWHCLEPISFDLSSADSIKEKAHRYLGQLTSISSSREEFKVYALLGEPQHQNLHADFQKALTILQKAPKTVLIREDEAVQFSERFATDIEQHQRAIGA